MQEPEKEIRVLKKVKEIRSKESLFLSRLKRRLSKHVWPLRIVLGIGVSAIVCLILFGIFSSLNFFGFSKYIGLISTFIFTPMEKIESIRGRTNILILGKGGAGHEAPDLTDTMIFASISHENKGLTLVSLPRDIWVSELRAKLNSAYYWGNQKTSGGGLILAKATVEEIIGQPIHYAIVVDLSELKRVINILDGIEVNVENAFVDEKYPITGREADECDGDIEFACRYETLKFEKGVQKMDGETALKFVRSRTAVGDEGTDFARASRQQKVIDAIEKKIFSREVLFSPNKIKALLDLYNEVAETNMSPDGAAILARRLLSSKDKIASYVLGEEFLDNPPILPKYDNLYVFLPKGGNWDLVRNWITRILE